MVYICGCKYCYNEVANMTTKNGKARNLTIKERRFVKSYVKTGNATEAAILSYDTHKRDTAKSLGKQVLDRPIVKEYLKQILDRKGLSLEDLADKMYESIDYNRKMGKGSQAVAADLMKFSYKLHDAIPANKSLNVMAKVEASSDLPTDLSSLTETLKELAESNRLILESINK